MIEAAVFLIFILGVSIYAVIFYNSLVRLRNDNDRAFANIDVLLKQLHDEIPNLIETVKGYMQHEQQTLVALTQARAASMNAASGSGCRKRSGISVLAPLINAAYGMPQAIAWNIGTISSTRSLADIPKVSAVQHCMECSQIDRWE